MYKKKKIFSLYSIWKQLLINKFNLLTKLNFYNINLLPNYSKLILTITLDKGLKNDKDVKIIDILYLLDYLTNSKSSIEKLITKYVRKNKTIVFVSKSTLISWVDIYLIIFYLKYSIMPYLNKKLLNTKFSINKNSFIIIIPDLSALEELPNFLKRFNIKIKLSFYFKNNLNKKLIYLYYKFLGI